MKRSIFFVFLPVILIATIMLTACKNNAVKKGENMDYAVACIISDIDGSEKLSDETILAMSDVIRTMISVNNTEKNNLISSESKPDDRILNLVSSTSCEIITNKTGSPVSNIGFGNDNKWTKTLQKSEMLSLLGERGIEVSSISNLTILESENSEFLRIGRKEIPIDVISDIIGKNDDKITSVASLDDSVTFEGETKNYFNIEVAEKLAEKSYDKNQIIKYFFSSDANVTKNDNYKSNYSDKNWRIGR